MSDIKKYSVLSYIFNGYEKVKEVINPDNECEYVLVTDDPNMKSNTWKIVYDEKLKDMSPFDKTFYVRYHPFEYVSNDIVVKMDASIKIKNGCILNSLIDKYIVGEYDYVGVPHPLIPNFFSDYQIWVNKRDYPIEKAKAQIYFLINKLQYNANINGFLQLMFLVENKNNRKTRLINDFTYSTIKYLSTKETDRLDQTIFNAYIGHLFKNDIEVLPLNFKCLFGDNLCWCEHGTEKELTMCYDSSKYGKEVYCFDKFVKTYEID